MVRSVASCLKALSGKTRRFRLAFLTLDACELQDACHQGTNRKMPISRRSAEAVNTEVQSCVAVLATYRWVGGRFTTPRCILGTRETGSDRMDYPPRCDEERSITMLRSTKRTLAGRSPSRRMK
jgi:hypothetical protein